MMCWINKMRVVRIDSRWWDRLDTSYRSFHVTKNTSRMSEKKSSCGKWENLYINRSALWNVMIFVGTFAMFYVSRVIMLSYSVDDTKVSTQSCWIHWRKITVWQTKWAPISSSTLVCFPRDLSYRPEFEVIIVSNLVTCRNAIYLCMMSRQQWY